MVTKVKTTEKEGRLQGSYRGNHISFKPAGEINATYFCTERGFIVLTMSSSLGLGRLILQNGETKKITPKIIKSVEDYENLAKPLLAYTSSSILYMVYHRLTGTII